MGEQTVNIHTFRHRSDTEARAQFAKLIEGRTLSPRAQELASLVKVALEQWPKIDAESRDALRKHVLKDIEELTRELEQS